jgi:hypothetical protein
VKRIALHLLLGLMLATAIQHRALSQVSAARQQEALATVEQYARDMMIVLPCFYMTAPPAMWEKGWGEPELNETLAAYQNSGASPAQVDALRRAYQDQFRPDWVADIRVVARGCYDNKIVDSLYRIEGVALPLMLRPPFRRSP